jgi:hypothetical protein
MAMGALHGAAACSMACSCVLFICKITIINLAQVPREQASSSSSSLVLAVQSPIAPASPDGGCARASGRLPCQCAAPGHSPRPCRRAQSCVHTWHSRSSCRRWSEVAVPLSYMAGRFVSWTCALSLIALMAMSVRTFKVVHQPRPERCCQLAGPSGLSRRTWPAPGGRRYCESSARHWR